LFFFNIENIGDVGDVTIVPQEGKDKRVFKGQRHMHSTNLP